MGYTSAMGEIAAANFTTTKVPGVAKPTNLATLFTFQNLQAQMNRVAHSKGIPKIAVDGDIGSATVKLWKAIWTGVPGNLSTYTYVTIAKVADTAGPQLKAMADAAGVPATVSSPRPAAPPSIVDPATGAVVQAPAGGGLTAMLENMDSTTQMAIGLGLAGVVFLALRKKKRR